MAQSIVAVHEAGHLIPAWYCASVSRISLAGVNPGRVLYQHSTANTVTTRWNSLVIALSGITAELKVEKTAKSAPSEGDLTEALKWAREIAEMVNPWEAFPVNTKGKNRITRMYSAKLSPAVQHILEAGYLKSKTILGRTEPDFYKAVSAFMTGANLGQKDFEAILGPRPVYDPNGSFVLPKKGAEELSLGQVIWQGLKSLFD